MLKSSIFYHVTERTVRRIYSGIDLPAPSSNMVSKGQEVVESESADIEFTPELKECLLS